MNLLIISLVVIFNFFTINKSAPLKFNEAVEFLIEFGFTNNKSSSLSEKEIEKSFKKYQNALNLPKTGKLDAATLAQMYQPMCERSGGLKIKNELYIWTKNHITYQIKNGPFSGRLNKQNIEDELKEAFKVWSQHIPITFERKDDFADIEIRFINPDSTKQTDGRGNTLAYAYYPEVGDIYFDAENWSLDSSNGYNFRLVAAHEIGHSLGLGHSKIKRSIMYDAYRPYKAGWTLHNSDISNIKELYSADHFCQFGQMDGIFQQKDKSIVVVKGEHCWKFENNKMKEGFPKLCEKIWRNFPAKIDAIFKDANKIYFFLENQLFSYGNNEKRKINFNKGSIKKIDTALMINERLYIFDGTKYWTFVRKNYSWTKKSDAKLISSFWNGVPSDLDAAFFDNKKYVYFFKNSEVYKFNIDTKNTIKSPFPISEYFDC